MSASTWKDIAINALLDLNVFQAGDVPSPDDLSYVIGKAQRLVDNWNAEGRALYADQFLTFVLTANLSPHTIGVTANTPTLTVTGVRPEDVRGASIVNVSVSPAVIMSRLAMRDSDWWRNQRVKALTSGIPTDCYYSADWPNGSLYFWPVPSTAYSVELQIPVALAAITDTTAFSLPPGYEDAITLTLEEAIAPAYGKQPPTLTAAQARARIFAQNDTPPRLINDAAGFTPRGRGGFNYLTGEVR